MRGFIVVEGHGEVAAAGNLISRLAQDLEFPLPWTPPIRAKNLNQPDGLRRAANRIRAEREVGALLILQDADEQCPKSLAPALAESLVDLALPFPVASVLLKPEYEVLFLPCLPNMAGRLLGPDPFKRPGLLAGTTWDAADWEARRGVKEWLSGHFPPGRAYKPTTDQLAMTRLIDFEVLRKSAVPCFGTLERALIFLSQNVGRASKVYPSSADGE